MSTVTPAQFGGRHGPAQHATASLDAEAWSAFATAASDADFCRAWLALQCAQITSVRAALLLLRAPGADAYLPAAVWPDARRDVTYLTAAAQRALGARRGTVLGLDPDDSEG